MAQRGTRAGDAGETAVEQLGEAGGLAATA